MSTTIAEQHSNREALEQAIAQLEANAESKRLQDRIARIPEVLASLTADQLASRFETALAMIGKPEIPEWRLRPRTKGAGKPYLILNPEGRSVIAMKSKSLAEAMADNRPGRILVDMTEIRDRARRKLLSNALRANPGNTVAHIPVIPLKSEPKEQKPYDPEAKAVKLASEVRREVESIQGLTDERKRNLLPVAFHWAATQGWEAMTDMLFELSLTLYTSVLDQQTQEIEHFETAEEASEYSTLMNQSPDGLLRNDKGQSLGRYRYRVINPVAYQSRLDRQKDEQ